MWNSHGTFYFTFIHTYVIHTHKREEEKRSWVNIEMYMKVYVCSRGRLNSAELI